MESKVTKSGVGHYEITRPNGSQFDGSLGALAEGWKVTKLETGLNITRQQNIYWNVIYNGIHI